MIVNYIQDNGNTTSMGFIHEAAQVTGAAVVVIRSKKVHTVVTPPKGARKLGYRHDLKGINPN